MDLNSLFVDYNQVEPASIHVNRPTLPQNIYLNLERAQQAISAEPASSTSPEPRAPEEDMSSWKVRDFYYQRTPEQAKPEGASSPAPGSKSGSSAVAQARAYVGGSSKSPTRSMKMDERAVYWMDKFAKLGLSPIHQMAIVSAMHGECGLTPKGAVERKELAGKGNTKKGWAHAGEGAVGFTHWNLKRDLIAKYNADPRRKGPKLSTNEAEYARPDSRHIADLDDDDHALMATLFYGDLLKKTTGMSFNDTVAEFYLQKAGRGFGGKTGTSHDKAMKAARVYQKSHAKLGYIEASKVNTYLKQLNFATRLSKITNQRIA